MRPLTAVVGSANLDVVVSAARRPDAGETVLGASFVEAAGGKGLNQAVAAAGVGPTAFVGTVGTDAAGGALRAALDAHGVDVTHLRAVPTATGRAFVTLTPDAENAIVVLPLANALLAAGAATFALDALAPRVVLTELETPLDVVAAVAAWCRSHGARFVLNPSPVAALDPAVLGLADPLVVNRGEAAALLAARAGTSDAAALARALAPTARSVVVTDGPRGAVVADGDGWARVPTPAVRAVDTTGAGDAFAGTLAARLAAGDALADAAESAARAAARVVGIARPLR